MVRGTVRYIDLERGFGFISRDDKQPKVFLHMSEVRKAGLITMEKGQRWIFDTEKGLDGRLQAVNLRIDDD